MPIVAALGVMIPKTASRAITSPAGTADTMETLAPVTLDARALRRVVEAEGGCVVWGGAANLSPADDILIRVERALDIDSDAQLVASVLSKKIAVGSTDVLVDIPMGPTAKVRSLPAANQLSRRLREVGDALHINVDVVISDGNQPVGFGIGPALEARDVLAVLRGDASRADRLTGTRPRSGWAHFGTRRVRVQWNWCRAGRIGISRRTRLEEIPVDRRGARRVAHAGNCSASFDGGGVDDRRHRCDRLPPLSAHCQTLRRTALAGGGTRPPWEAGYACRRQAAFVYFARRVAW